MIVGTSVLGFNMSYYFHSFADVKYLSEPGNYIVYSAIGVVVMLYTVAVFTMLMLGIKRSKYLLFILIPTLYGIIVFIPTWLMMCSKWINYI